MKLITFQSTRPFGFGANFFPKTPRGQKNLFASQPPVISDGTWQSANTTHDDSYESSLQILSARLMS